MPASVASLLLYAVVVNVCYLVGGEEGSNPSQKITTNATTSTAAKGNGGDYFGDYVSSKNMYRILLVLLSVTLITVVFFVCKIVSGRRHKKAKKYGVLATSGTDVELRPLDDDDDEEDEDVTVFDVNR